MYVIRNKNDLKTAYIMLRWFNANKQYSRKESVAELKREIRSYTHTNRNLRDNGYFTFESRYAYSYGDSDTGYVELVSFPLFFGSINSIEEAKEFFENWFYIEPYYTYYDCTGRTFTSWYHLFERNGRYYAYHRVAYDV